MPNIQRPGMGGQWKNISWFNGTQLPENLVPSDGDDDRGSYSDESINDMNVLSLGEAEELSSEKSILLASRNAISPDVTLMLWKLKKTSMFCIV